MSGTRVVYHIQKLDGYTDGKPSWLKVRSHWSKGFAEIERDKIASAHPTWKLRIRKITRRT